MKALKGNMSLDIRKTFAVSDGSQFSPACPDMSSIKMKMGIQQRYWHRKA